MGFCIVYYRCASYQYRFTESLFKFPTEQIMLHSDHLLCRIMTAQAHNPKTA